MSPSSVAAWMSDVPEVHTAKQWAPETGVVQGPALFVALLEKRRPWLRWILSHLDALEGTWISALAKLSEEESTPCDADRVAALLGAAESELGDVLSARLREAATELGREGDPPQGEGAWECATQVIAVIQAGVLFEDASQVGRLLRGGSPDATGEAFVAGLALLEDVVEEAVEHGWVDFDKDQRRQACHLLGQTRGAWGMERLVAALDEGDPKIRVAAASALGRRKDSAPLGELVRSLEEALLLQDLLHHEEVRALEASIAQVAAGSAHGQSRVIELLASWSIGAEESVRESFAGILAGLDAPDRSDWLEPILNDPSPAVREIGALATSQLEDAPSLAFRDRLLEDEAAPVRQALAVALGHASDPAALECLERLIEDEDPRVRAAAFRSLATRLGGAPRAAGSERVVGWIDKAVVSGGTCAMAVGDMLCSLDAPQAIPVVRRLLREMETEALRAAISSLSRHPEETVLLELRAVLGHREGAVRVEAAEVLAARGIRELFSAIMAQFEIEEDALNRDALRAAARRLQG